MFIFPASVLNVRLIFLVDHLQNVADKKESDQVNTFEGSDNEPPEEEKIVRQNDVANTELTLDHKKFSDRFSKRKKVHLEHQLKPKPKVMEWQPSLRKRPLTLLEKVC